jgi:general secretion pathway protein D
MKIISKIFLITAIAIAVSGALSLHAQQQGGFGGFGGFGGGGGGGGNANRGTSSSQQTYNPNGNVGNANISIDPDSHNITIIADEATTKYIQEVVNNLDRPQPQVLIKVVFLEVTHSDSLDLGIEGSYNRNLGGGLSRITGYMTNFSLINAGTSNAAIVPSGLKPITSSFAGNNNFGLASQTGSAGTYSIIGQDFQATLRAIAQAGKSQLLSRPSILARNNQPATIVVGQQVPLITNVRYDTFGNAINSITYQNVGIILKVTPFITGEGLVQMIVQPQTSSVNPDPNTRQPISAGVSAPVIDIRSADTVVVTPDGQTVVIGGLMQNDTASGESKIPFLGDIPFLGNLFKHKTKSSAKTELLIFLTPHVIEAPSQLASLTDKEKNHTFTPKSYSEDELDRFLEKVPIKRDDGKPAKHK